MPMQRAAANGRSRRVGGRRSCALAAIAAGACFAVAALRERFATSSGRNFLAGNAASAPRCRSVSRARGATSLSAYTFGIAESDDHTGLVVEEKDEGVQVKTTGGEKLMGHWNTVLGDQELPASGRSYFEVKIIDKPTDAWEFIGVAEKTADVTVPLTRNRKGKGWFVGATWAEAMVYKYLEIDKKKFQDEAKVSLQMMQKEAMEKYSTRGPGIEKELAEHIEEVATWQWDAPGTHVGSDPDFFPPLKTGMVVGVDVDMDKGSLAFWADGKYLGVVRDHATSKPLDLKGKKLVPAVSVFGREMADGPESTVMEVRRGLEPPALP